MVSINPAATSALQVLRNTNASLEVTQARITTGVRVASAKDDATAWATAQTLRSENGTSATIGKNIAAMKTQASLTGAVLGQVSNLLADMRALIVSATAADADKTAIQSQISDIQAQLRGAVGGATISGSNWLDGTKATVSIIASQQRSAAGVTSLDTIAIDLSKAALIDGGEGALDLEGVASDKAILAFDVSAADTAALTTMLTDLDTAAKSVSASETTIAASNRRLTDQGEFLLKLQAIRDSAIGDLVDADVPTETAKLQALQVRQQLAIQSLAIANSQESIVLQLFR